MKSHKNLYHKITNFSNLLLAARKAQKGKRFKKSIAFFNLNLEKELLQLQGELRQKSYRHGPYYDFLIYDPKRRLISAALYRDRVVHHALCNVIEPLFDKTFIHDSYACRKGKGVHAAANRYTKFARGHKYVLKCDIRKYFQGIDHEILLNIISKKIACEDTRWLINNIINTRCDEKNYFYFKGDDLFTPYNRKKGLPLGNLTSQFFANVYLNEFDHFIKENFRCPYIRYVDDFVAFDDCKNRLHEIKRGMVNYLDSLRLKLHDRKCRIYRVEDGVNFLGYRIFPTHRLLNKENVLRMRRRLKKLNKQYREGEVPFSKINSSIQSWIGHACHADTYKLRSRILGNVVFQRQYS